MAKANRHVYQQSTWGPALAQLMATSRNCRSQTALARKSGVGQSTIGRILRGETDPQTGTMTLLAEALGVPFKTLAACAAGEKIERPEEDESTMDRVEQALKGFRDEMNSSIDQLRDFVRDQRCCRPADASADRTRREG